MKTKTTNTKSKKSAATPLATARASADRVSGLSKAEMRTFLAAADRIAAKDAPSAAAAGSDLLPVLQAVVLEFARRHYPAAQVATVSMILPPARPGVPAGYVCLPMPTAAA